jgi:hypothetical protein
MGDCGGYSNPKARKIYVCGWCGEIILKAERHTHFKGSWQGEWQDWRMHKECNDALVEDGEIIPEGFIPRIGKRGRAEFN